MKWYLHKHHAIHVEDIKYPIPDSIEMYYQWVHKIARSFPKHSIAIGALNYQDLVQAGYVGLVEAWNKVDHSRTQGEIWTFLKKRIKWAIRREVDKHGAFIKIPRRNLEF